jgi:4'-phosphopantetheinyl transferase EntD
MQLNLINSLSELLPAVPGLFYGIAEIQNLNDFNITVDEEKDLFARGRSSEKRIKSFSLGRLAARRSLLAFGNHDQVSIRKGERGEPLWPAGIKGSIAHTDQAGIAVCTKNIECKGIGIDFESALRSLDFDIGRYIATAREQEWMQSGRGSERALKLFCLKEAFYKAFSPIVGRFIGFQEVEFVFLAENVQSVILNDSLPQEYKVNIHLSANETWVVAVCILEKIH